MIAQDGAPAGVTREAVVNGARLAWREAGSGEPLVLLHGFPFDSRLWEPQLRSMPPGWRGIAPDLRGFGRSERGDLPLTMEQHARDVLALLDLLEIDRAVVGGLSMGGYCALAIHRIAPARVRALVLCDTRAEADSDEARRQRAGQAVAARERGVTEVVSPMIERLLAPGGAGRHPAVRHALEAMMSAHPRRHAGGSLARSGGSAGRAASAGRYQRTHPRPRWRARPVITPAPVLAGLAAAIPGATLRLLPLAGHVANLEAEADFNDGLHAFLAGLERSPGSSS